MTFLVFVLIIISIFLSVSAQILLKNGMSSQSVTQALSSGPIDSILSIVTNISVLSGLTAYVASVGFWLIVLSRMDVSKAYPFVGLGFILTMLFAYIFLNEPITTMKLVGTSFVFIGIILVSMS
jgi:multidrug transporter EmrE-like cation transporter